MRHQARLSRAVPHRTAFLPPAFMDTLPPTHEASAEVGSTAKTNPAASAAPATRRVTTPAPPSTVATGTATPGKPMHHAPPRPHGFSVFITAQPPVTRHAPPVYPVTP